MYERVEPHLDVLLLEQRLHLFLLSLLEQFELELLLPARLRRHPNVLLLLPARISHPEHGRDLFACAR